MGNTKTVVPTTTPEPYVLTSAMVRTGEGIDLDAATAYVRHLKGEADQSTRLSVWEAARLTHGVVAAGNIGKGEGKHYPTQGDYAREIGFSEGWVSRLKSVGRAIAVHGVTKASAEYAFLVQHAANAKVSAAIKSEDTREFKSLLKTYMSQMAEHGRILGETRAPQIGDGTEETGEAEGETVAGEVVETPADPMVAVLAAVKALDAACKAAGFTPETWAPVEDSVNKILTREVTLLAKQAKGK